MVSSNYHLVKTKCHPGSKVKMVTSAMFENCYLWKMLSLKTVTSETVNFEKWYIQECLQMEMLPPKPSKMLSK